ncbi:4a-hydroxytetrahydrobiopterin dehydratase family protein [Gorillibacterium timonense]|nr:4a-hydroxytetrahydrobiopterin dehydratase [Gorillibacterium timonense]
MTALSEEQIVRLSTDSAGGVTGKDFLLAEQIKKLM